MTSNRRLPGATETRPGAVVMFSGGMDSTTLLADAIIRYGRENVTAVSFEYGQRHARELEQARIIAVDFFGVAHVVVNMPRIFSGGRSSLMGDIDVQEMGSYEDLERKYGGQPTIVPGRNLNFIAQAATIAEIKGLDTVLLANHAGDSGAWHYFDCSPEFIAGASIAVAVGTGFAVSLEAPYTRMSKSDIVKRAAEIGAPLHLSQSCYKGSRPACGQCATCHERQTAFFFARYIDPIEYATLTLLSENQRPFPIPITLIGTGLKIAESAASPNKEVVKDEP